MSADKSDSTPPSAPAIPDWVWQLLILGGGGIALMSAFPGLAAGFERAGPLLHKLGTTPMGFWTIQFLVESIFKSLFLIIGEILNKTTVIGAIVCGVGYFLHTSSNPPTQSGSPA